jgi:hypothetical protein
MKTTIILTDEQIEQLTKAEKELLLINKNKAIEEIEKKYNADVLKLTNKYKTIDIDIKETIEQPKKETSIKTKLTDELLKSYFNAGKTIDEIVELTNKSKQTIRQKLSKLGLKLTERK